MIYFIPIYYSVSYEEYINSCRIEHNEPRYKEELFNEAIAACAAYRADVEAAIEASYAKHISTFKEKHPTFPVYSRTWGK